MSPDFEAVMERHPVTINFAAAFFNPTSTRWNCTCGAMGEDAPSAHLAAVLRAEVAAWLGSDEVTRQSAEAMEDAALTHLGRDLGTIHRDDIAKAALDVLAGMLGGDS